MHTVTALVLGAALASGVTLAFTQEGATATPPPAPTPAPAPWLDLPACTAEDGPGPCLWDAQTAGNGKGVPFFIGADHCTYRFGPHGPYRATEFPCTDPYKEAP